MDEYEQRPLVSDNNDDKRIRKAKATTIRKISRRRNERAKGFNTSRNLYNANPPASTFHGGWSIFHKRAYLEGSTSPPEGLRVRTISASPTGREATGIFLWRRKYRVSVRKQVQYRSAEQAVAGTNLADK